MSNSKLHVTLLADEWKSSKGGLSTINRELAIHLAKHPNVSVTFLVPKCTEDDKNASSSCNVRIVKAQERPGFDDPVDWLSFPPNDLPIDIVIGHGVKLGKHAQIIRESHRCKWVQVVHTAPEQLSMLKTYSDCENAISRGDRKQWNEIQLCKIADLVVAVGPRLWEFYSRYLRRFKIDVFNLTPGIFSELSSLELSIPVEGEMFNILLFGRGDSEDFALKGFDIAAKAVAQLNDTSYQLVFVGATSGNEKELADKLLEGGLRRKQLIVKEYLEDWEDLATVLSAADLAIIPSRSEGFGLTALEALSVGLPFLVTQTSGFGKALQDALPQSTPWIVDSEESDKWAEAIKSVRKKGRKAATAECQTLRESYGKKYTWESQCNALVEKMISLVSEASIVYRPDEQSSKTHPEVKNAQLKDKSDLSSSARSPLTKDQRMTERRLEEKNGGRREGFSAHDFGTTSGRKSSYFNSQGTPPEKNLLSGLERPKASPSRMESSVTAAAPSQRLNEASIVYLPGEKSFKTHPERKNSQLKHESKLASSARSPLPEDQRLTEQRLEDISGGRREGFTAHDFETTSGRRSSYFSCLGNTPEKNLSSGLENPKVSPSKMESSVTAVPSQGLSEASIVYRPDEKSFKTHPEVKKAQLKNESELVSSARSPLPEDHRLTEQRLEDQNGGRRQGFTAHDFETTSVRRSSYFSAQGTTPKKNLSADLERPKAPGSTMEPSFTAAPSPSLNEASIVISEIKEKQSGAPSKSEQCQKLQENRPGHFVGVDEGEDVSTVIGGDDNYKDDNEENREVISSSAKEKVSSQFGREYLGGRKSFISSWNKQHRAIQEQALLYHFDPNKKGLKFEYRPPTPNQQLNSEPQLQETSTELENPYTSRSCLHNGKDTSLLTAGKEENPTDSHPSCSSSAAGGIRDSLGMEPSLSNQGDSAYKPNTHMIRPRGSQEPDINADLPSNYLHNITTDHLQTEYLELKSCHDESSQNTPQPVLATQLPGNPPPVVVLRSIARYGRISKQLGELQVWDPEFKIPDDIQDKLLTKHCDTPETGVRIIRYSDGTLECHNYQNFKKFFLNEDIKLAKDEFLVMKTRIRHGKASFEDVDVQFKLGNVHIPQDIISGFKEKDSADLYVISGAAKNFRLIVKRESVFKRVRESVGYKYNIINNYII